MENVTIVKNLKFLRFIARLVPVKYKLNIFINKYLHSEKSVVIPYFNNYAIVVNTHWLGEWTISNLIFDGGNSLPEFNLLQRIKNDLPQNYVCVDVGANLGTIIWQLADKCGHIYAFEPLPKLNQIIADSCTYNKFNKLSLYKKAVGSKIGVVQMPEIDNSSILNSTSNIKSIEIEVTTLDKELENVDRIDFLKIDVEGYELEVLKGAAATLKKHKPILLIELHPVFLKNYDVNYEDVLYYLEKANYSVSYYSFLTETRMGKVRRFLSRYLANTGKRFNTKEDFIQDIEMVPAVLSYHLHCVYKN